jgi:hypothetical protein
MTYEEWIKRLDGAREAMLVTAVDHLGETLDNGAVHVTSHHLIVIVTALAEVAASHIAMLPPKLGDDIVRRLADQLPKWVEGIRGD